MNSVSRADRRLAGTTRRYRRSSTPIRLNLCVGPFIVTSQNGAKSGPSIVQLPDAPLSCPLGAPDVSRAGSLRQEPMVRAPISPRQNPPGSQTPSSRHHRHGASQANITVSWRQGRPLPDGPPSSPRHRGSQNRALDHPGPPPPSTRRRELRAADSAEGNGEPLNSPKPIALALKTRRFRKTEMDDQASPCCIR